MTSKESQLSIEKKYKHLTDHEHILKRSDMYVGTVDTNTVNMWIYDKNSNKFKKEDILFSPALYKIVDEILVNARDHTVNDHTCDTIRVDINQENNHPYYDQRYKTNLGNSSFISSSEPARLKSISDAFKSNDPPLGQFSPNSIPKAKGYIELHNNNNINNVGISDKNSLVL
jgi:hypothetical protein